MNSKPLIRRFLGQKPYGQVEGLIAAIEKEDISENELNVIVDFVLSWPINDVEPIIEALAQDFTLSLVANRDQILNETNGSTVTINQKLSNAIVAYLGQKPANSAYIVRHTFKNGKEFNVGQLHILMNALNGYPYDEVRPFIMQLKSLQMSAINTDKEASTASTASTVEVAEEKMEVTT